MGEEYEAVAKDGEKKKKRQQHRSSESMERERSRRSIYNFCRQLTKVYGKGMAMADFSNSRVKSRMFSYHSTKRKKNDQLFGFVRFTRKEEALRVPKRMDKVIIRDCKIVLKEAAYSQDQRQNKEIKVPKRAEITSHSQRSTTTIEV